ncbi:MAG: VanZ family protein [Lachnospiraceae bacterium]|nr:VanZ family protein [Lachnospiraceae bacterium]MCI1397747.1 VanZ family protein [Lachnospiraceae bacterium]MCI1423361.1 VanZ family protein [Lachnospiraceae bacterium]MCI1452222.1 VanZ family protein [Lachnospiraceae bacterium]
MAADNPQKYNHKRTRALQVLSVIPACLWGSLIFGFSSQNAQESSGLSQKVTAALIEGANDAFSAGWSKAQILYYESFWEFWVRKAAHFTEYLIFGLLLVLPLYLCGLVGKRLVLTALLIAACYATSDELHQFLSPGRSPGVRDVCIDTCGALIGILLARAIYRRGRSSLFRGLVSFRANVLKARRDKAA